GNNCYLASNANSATYGGTDPQLDWHLSAADRLRLTYAYVDTQASNPTDEQFTARNSGSAVWRRDWGAGWSSALFYYGDDAINQYRFQRVDLRVAPLETIL